MDLVKKCMWRDPSAQEGTAREGTQPNTVHWSLSDELQAASTQQVTGQQLGSGGTGWGPGHAPANI